MIASDERLARAALCHVPRPGDPRVHRLIAEWGAAETWERLQREPSLADALGRVDPAADVAMFSSLGGRLVCPGDPEWPDSVSILSSCDGAPGDPREPYALWVRGAGDLAQLSAAGVAIVGSRASTDYGSYVASEMAGELAGAGWAVVSGGAFGIDAAAHRGALVVGGATIAVLACGADVAYPKAHDTLFARILCAGCVVSEEPPGRGVRRERFLSRNRLIAALTKATVLVEAGARSGALSTARHAQRMLRDVLAVPGPVTSAMSRGCHEQLREGYARIVTSAADVIAELGPLAPTQPVLGPVTTRDRMSQPARVVLDGFPAYDAVSPADVSFAAGVPIAQVLGELDGLIASGFVELCDGGFRLTRSAREGR